MFPKSNYLWTCPLCRHQQRSHRDPESKDTHYNKRCPECGTEMRGSFIVKDGPTYTRHYRRD
jgi:transcription elongation factor Elf1